MKRSTTRASERHVAIYARISDDHRIGRGEGVATQERWGRAYAAQHWPGVPVVVYSDNDLSASDPTVHRPRFAAMREAIRAGEVCALWSVEQSRLERTAGWFAFAAELDAAGIEEVHTRRDGVVRVLDDVAGIKAVLAAGEARRTKRRIRDRLDVLASEGRPSGGRPYGYRPGVDEHGRKTLVVVEEEAAIIRETADRIMSGWSLTRIADDLKARGVVGVLRRKIRNADRIVTGYVPPRPMSTPTIRSIVTNLTVVGRRTHRGQVVPATWPAILDEAVWDACRDELAAPRIVVTAKGHRAIAGQQRARRKYLLTGGITVCGRCGVELVASPRLSGGVKKTMYWCSPKRQSADGVRGCGRLGILGEVLEPYVLEVLFAELAKPAFVEALSTDPHAERRGRIDVALRSVEAKRRALVAEWDADRLTMEEWAEARARLDARERDLREERATIPRPARRRDVDALRDLRDAWPFMTLDEQVAIVTDFIGQIAVLPARRGGVGPQPAAERVAPPETWWRRT